MGCGERKRAALTRHKSVARPGPRPPKDPRGLASGRYSLWCRASSRTPPWWSGCRSLRDGISSRAGRPGTLRRCCGPGPSGADSAACPISRGAPTRGRARHGWRLERSCLIGVRPHRDRHRSVGRIERRCCQIVQRETVGRELGDVRSVCPVFRCMKPAAATPPQPAGRTRGRDLASAVRDAFTEGQI